jgi:hypothetical protein
LADTAYRTRAEPQTIEALHAVVTTTPQLEAFYDFGQPATVVDGTPDARILVGGTESGTVSRLERATGTIIMARRPIKFLLSATTQDHRGDRYPIMRIKPEPQSALWHDGG